MILFKISNLKVRATKRYTNYDTNGFIINFTVFRVFKYRQIFDFISSVFFLRQQLGQKLDDIFCLKQQTLIGGIKMSHLNRIAMYPIICIPISSNVLFVGVKCNTTIKTLFGQHQWSKNQFGPC